MTISTSSQIANPYSPVHQAVVQETPRPSSLTKHSRAMAAVPLDSAAQKQHAILVGEVNDLVNANQLQAVTPQSVQQAKIEDENLRDMIE